MALFASARARPCSGARSSDVRSARSSSPSSLKLIPPGIGVFKLPFGPFTSSTCSPIVTETPLGSMIIFLPMRDIIRTPGMKDESLESSQLLQRSSFILHPLVNLRQQFSTDVFTARRFPAHQTLGS